MHLKFSTRLGNENRNSIHLFHNNSESAYFLQDEIDTLKDIRRKKTISKKYLENHYKEAYVAIKKLDVFLHDNARKAMGVNKNPMKLFLRYSNLFENLLSYYRASRPEIFEIVEEILNDKKINKQDEKYYKALILRYGKLRLDIKKAWLSAEKKIKSLKRKMAKLLGLKADEFEYLTLDELKDSTKKNNIKLYKKLIKERKFCVFGIIKGRKILIMGKDKVNIIVKHLEPKIIKVKEILGKPANPGFVKGKVRIVPQVNYKEMITKAGLFKKGEILVTGMTQPDIIFACKKARAIITDEGGITSHAAIISRELNIPCIIGTKIATKVLRDGDLVEVDANVGVVKILNQ